MFRDVFPIIFELLFIKDEMSEVGSIIHFEKEEHEQSLEEVDALNNTKEVCQKPPCTSVS